MLKQFYFSLWCMVVVYVQANAETILDVMSNSVSVQNLPGAAQLSLIDPEETFAQSILESAENYSLFLASYVDLVMDAGRTSTLSSMLLAADNLCEWKRRGGRG